MATLRELMAKQENLVKTNKRPGKEVKTITENNLTLDALTTILEMVENDALTSDEVTSLQETIEYIFNNILESEDEEYTDDEDEDDEYTADDEEEEYTDDEEIYYTCDNEECGWSGTESELVENEDADMVCPECGSYVSEDAEDEDSYEDSEDEDSYEDSEDLEEGMVLNKTSMADKKASKQYARSAAGKKTLKLQAKKRSKYATKIARCTEKGKTFSFKEMTCVKPKKRR